MRTHYKHLTADDRLVFRGEFTVTSIVFDGLGLFWLGKGVRVVYNARTEVRGGR